MIWVSCIIVLSALGADPPSPSGQEIEHFEKKIRPLLIQRCGECHGPEKQSGGLRLDRVADLKAGGDQGSPFVPRDPSASLIVQAIRYTNEDFQMPPDGKLADAEIQLIEDWIGGGAPLPPESDAPSPAKNIFSVESRKDHWAYQAVGSPLPPAVAPARVANAENPIDLFLDEAREKKNLSTSRRVEDGPWLRRVTFDLTGLPPTPAEFDHLASDLHPDHRSRAVDRLLASPRYGERWARHWLDLVRYSESLGHEFDYDIAHAWRYRDYVIRAFNDDLPFATFTREQIAGDLLPARVHAATGVLESTVGTAFFWFGEQTHSPVDVRQAETDRIDNQIDVLTKTFLGQSVACARCHDHKFDAISQRDYYALAGYLKSSRYDQASLVPMEQSIARARTVDQARAERDRSLTPWLLERAAGLEDELAHLDPRKIPDDVSHPLYLLRASRDLAPTEFVKHVQEWANRLNAAAEPRAGDHTFESFEQAHPNGWTFFGDAFLPAEPPSAWMVAPGETLSVQLGTRGMIDSSTRALRAEGVARSPTFQIEADYIHVRCAGRGARVNVIVDGFTILRDPIYGGLVQRVDQQELHWRTLDVRKWVGHRAYLEFADTSTPNPTDGFDPLAPVHPHEGFIRVDEVVFSSHRQPPPTKSHPSHGELLANATTRDDLIERLAKRAHEGLRSLADQQQPPEKDLALLRSLLAAGLMGGTVPSAQVPAPLTELVNAARAHETEYEAGLQATPRTPALVDGTAENEFLLVRGNHQTPSDPVPRRFLEVLGGTPTSSEEVGRLDLADRLADSNNPLVPRVLVNRLWKHHFGKGIVRSTDDFGRMGQMPTHPELLDWLARDFLQAGGSIKHMHRLMLASSAAQLSSDADPSLVEQDPNNELLTRMPVRRLEAEAIRDTILSVSGRFDDAMGGVSIPPILTDFMPPIGRPSRPGPLDGEGRRSIYLSVRRNFLNPMLLAFDYPLPQTTMGQRNVSNVPAQALSLLNDPFVWTEARRLAERLLAEHPNDPDRVTALYRQAIGRSPHIAEQEALHDALQQMKAQPPIEVWTTLCHALFNTKEFIFVP